MAALKTLTVVKFIVVLITVNLFHEMLALCCLRKMTFDFPMSQENIDEGESISPSDLQGEVKEVNPTFFSCYLI